MPIYILSATNRENSNTYKISCIIKEIYKNLKVDTEIISLEKLSFFELKKPYSDSLPVDIQSALSKIAGAGALVIVCPEYNGSFPGIFKYFIDLSEHPKTFALRPISFVGLGGRFGGLRAVEQMEQIMHYRQAFIYPKRVFIQNVSEVLKADKLIDSQIEKQLIQQAKGFLPFAGNLKKQD